MLPFMRALKKLMKEFPKRNYMLMTPYKEYTKEDGVKVTKYRLHPDASLYVLSINLETGKVKYSKVLEYSKHENLKMYKITFPDGFSFHASSDHSLIVYDILDQKLKKVTPKDVIKNADHYCFVRYNSKEKSKTYIHATNVTIEEDDSVTYGYDFTVEDDYTFALGNGVFVQDSMAVYMPLTVEAKDDAEKKMAFTKNLLVPGSMAFDNIQQNVVYGIYKATLNDPDAKNIAKEFKDIKEFADWATDNLEVPVNAPNLTIKIGDTLTTAGRAFVSSLIGLDYVVNQPIDRSKLNNLITYVLQKHFIEDYEFSLDKLQTLFVYGTIMSDDLTISLKDFILDEELEKIISDKKKELIKQFKENPKAVKINIKKTIDTLNELSELLLERLPGNIRAMFKSKAKGNKAQMSQIFIAKGFVTDITNKPVPTPIFSSLIEGLTPDQFIIMSKAARKGSADRSIRTSEPGELTRKLVFALNPVELDETLECCDTDRFLEVELTPSNAHLYIYRYINDNGKRVLLNHETIKKYIGQTVKLYSPIFCKSEKICKTCFGEYYKYLNSPFIGMITSQSLGERATQLIMRTFHTGGTAQVDDIVYPPEYFEEVDDELKVKKDIIVFGEAESGNLSSTTTFTLRDPNTDEELPTTLTLPAQSKLYISISGERYVKAGTVVAKLPESSKGIASAIEYVKSILESSRISKFTYKDLYNALVKIFGDLGVLSIWVELLISYIMRDPRDKRNLWRLLDDRDSVKPELVHIVAIPFMRPLLALAFQDIRKSLKVISEFGEIDIHDLTVLERIFLSRF